MMAGELLQELNRVKQQMGRSIAPDRLEFDEDASVGSEAHAVLGKRGAEEIAAELFEAGAIVGGTQTLAWRSKPSSWAWRGPREVT